MNRKDMEGRFSRSGRGLLYILVGEDHYLAAEAMAALRAAFLKDAPDLAWQERHGDSLTPRHLLEDLRTRPLGVETEGWFVVVRPSDLFLQRHRGALETGLDRGWPGSLVLCVSKLDKRWRLARAKGVEVVEGAPPKDLVRWIRERASEHGVQLDAAAARVIADRVGPRPSSVEMELKKLAPIARMGENVGAELVASLVPEDREVVSWDLTEAIAEGRGGDAVEILDRMLASGEEPIRLVGLLAWQVRRLRKARASLDAGVPADRVAREARVPPSVAPRFLGQLRKLTRTLLAERTARLLEADRALKGGLGAVEPRTVLTSLVARLAGAG